MNTDLIDAFDRLCAAGPVPYRRELAGRLVLERMGDRYDLGNLTEAQARAAVRAVLAVPHRAGAAT